MQNNYSISFILLLPFIESIGVGITQFHYDILLKDISCYDTVLQLAFSRLKKINFLLNQIGDDFSKDQISLYFRNLKNLKQIILSKK